MRGDERRGDAQGLEKVYLHRDLVRRAGAFVGGGVALAAATWLYLADKLGTVMSAPAPAAIALYVTSVALIGLGALAYKRASAVKADVLASPRSEES
jgi:hypothetical protein